MYGINLIEVARILGTVAISHGISSKHGLICSIHQEIVKHCAQQDIAMVKVMMRMLATQNQEVYDDMMKALSENFSPEELKAILP